MAQSTLAVTAGSGTLLDTWTYSKGGNTVHNEFMLPGEFPYASYHIVAESISIATANDHILQVMAGGSLNLRVRYIILDQAQNATTGAATSLQILRLTTAGTGGTAITPARMVTSDSAAGCTGMTLPTAKGTESTVFGRYTQAWRQAVSTTASPADDQPMLWTQHPGMEPLTILAGTSNGFAIKSLTAVAGATVNIIVGLVEQNF